MPAVPFILFDCLKTYSVEPLQIFITIPTTVIRATTPQRATVPASHAEVLTAKIVFNAPGKRAARTIRAIDTVIIYWNIPIPSSSFRNAFSAFFDGPRTITTRAKSANILLSVFKSLHPLLHLILGGRYYYPFPCSVMEHPSYIRLT